jgi:hypothetical protein
MGDMSKVCLTGRDDLPEICGRIPCISCVVLDQPASPSLPSNIFCVKIATGSVHSAQLCRFLPEDRDRIQSPKRCVLNKKQDDGCRKTIIL